MLRSCIKLQPAYHFPHLPDNVVYYSRAEKLNKKQAKRAYKVQFQNLCILSDACCRECGFFIEIYKKVIAIDGTYT
jgi:hypothetical protein